MAGVYLAMIAEQGRPVTGNQRDMLGVREGRDIPVGSTDIVLPATGGLSVAPHWKDLPPFLIPRRLKGLYTAARGSDRLACFRLGYVPFANRELDDDLTLRVENSDHAIIEPKCAVQIAVFQAALAATMEMWTIDEALP